MKENLKFSVLISVYYKEIPEYLDLSLESITDKIVSSIYFSHLYKGVIIDTKGSFIKFSLILTSLSQKVQFS